MHFVPIAKVLRTHGVRGWIKVLPLTDDPERFLPHLKVYAGRTSDGQGDIYVLEKVRSAAKDFLLKFRGIDSREDAANLRGLYITIPENQVPPVEDEDTYYYYQIIGLRAIDSDGKEWGHVVNIFPTGSNDVYVMEGEGRKEYYLPALKQAIKRIDLAGGVMFIDPSWLT